MAKTDKSISFIFPHNDIKFSYWADALKKQNVTSAVKSFYRLSFFSFLLSLDPCGKVVIYRYLNCKTKAEALIKLIFDLLITLICSFRGIRIAWILHNIDSETHDCAPKITGWRRGLVEKASHAIFVTDALLIDHAKKFLPQSKHKIDYISFGPYDKTGRYHENKKEISNIIGWVREKKANGHYIGVSVTSPAAKNNQHLTIQWLLDNTDVAIVAVGDIGNLDENERLFYIKENFQVSKLFWDEFDFVIKGTSDLSVLLSCYMTANLGLPIVTYENNFFADFVAHYGLGICVGEKSNNTFVVPKVDRDKYASFLKDKNWDKAATRMIDAIEAC